MGSSARWPSPRSSRYHAQPIMRTASATRSVTESKKAPRTEAVPAALATGPSRRSCMPVMIKKMMARWRWPVATRTAVAVAETRPVAVSTSAVMPWRCSDRPTGPVVRSTASRQRPSNMELLVVRGPGDGTCGGCKSLPSCPRTGGLPLQGPATGPPGTPDRPDRDRAGRVPGPRDRPVASVSEMPGGADTPPPRTEGAHVR